MVTRRQGVSTAMSVTVPSSMYPVMPNKLIGSCSELRWNRQCVPKLLNGL